MVKAVLFDLGDVLELCGDGSWQEDVLRRAGELGGLTGDEVRERLMSAELPDLAIEGTEQAYWAGFARALGLDDAAARTLRTYFWDRYCGEPNTELLEFAHGLHGRVKLGILSNSGDGARREEEQRYGHSRWFAPILLSHEIGMEKPDPAIFRYACECLGEAPADVLLVDNNEENVAAARSVGMRALQHTANATTIAGVTAELAAG